MTNSYGEDGNDTITRIDPKSGETNEMAVGGSPTGITVGKGVVWVLVLKDDAEDAVVRIPVAAAGGGDGDEASAAETPEPTQAPAPEGAGAAGGVTEEQFSQIAIGQTMNEVRAILGKPDSSLSVGGECWYWGISKGGGKFTAAEVCFDRKGLVIDFGEG